MEKVRKKYIPYNGYYYLRKERSKTMNKEWYYLEITNLQEIISKSDPSSKEYEDAMTALNNLTKQLIEIERFEADQKRDDDRRKSQSLMSRNDIIKTCIASATLFGGIILVAAIEREAPIPQKLFNIITKVLPKVV